MSKTEVKVPERWKEVRRQCTDFLEHPGEPSTKPIEWCIQIIDDLAASEAKIECLKRLLSSEEKQAVAFRFGGGSVENEFNRIIAARQGEI